MARIEVSRSGHLNPRDSLNWTSPRQTRLAIELDWTYFSEQGGVSNMPPLQSGANDPDTEVTHTPASGET